MNKILILILAKCREPRKEDDSDPNTVASGMIQEGPSSCLREIGKVSERN